ACLGANPVVCTAMDECHDVGTCDPTTGQCSNPPKTGGSCGSGGGGGSAGSNGGNRGIWARGARAGGMGGDSNPGNSGGAGTGASAGNSASASSGSGGAPKGGSPEQSSGCGCRVVGADDEHANTLILFGLALGVTLASRRRTARYSWSRG